MAKKITLEEYQKRFNLTVAKPESPILDTPTVADTAKAPVANRTIGLEEYKKRLGRKGRTVEEDEEDYYPFDKSDTLKKDDLKKGRAAKDIRNHMKDRFGVDYNEGEGKSDSEVVEEFVDSMRWMNSNTVSVAGAVRFITDADEETKARAGKAYELYDQLGNVFVNDGVAGAVDGIKDYLFASAADPTNYLGLLTGGVAKASGVGLTQAGRMAVKRAAVEAGKKATATGVTKEGAKKAATDMYKSASKRMATEGVTRAESKALRRAAAKKEYDIFMENAKRKARRDSVKLASVKDGKKILAATTAADAMFAVVHDYQLQSTLMEAGAQEEYSVLQTGFSSLFGSVAGLTQLGFGKLAGGSGLSDAVIDLKIGGKRTEEAKKLDIQAKTMGAKSKPINIEMDEKVAKEAADEILKYSSLWRNRVEQGISQFDDVPTSVSFLRGVMLGDDGKGGLAKLFKDQGVPLPKDVPVSAVMTDVVSKLPQETLEAINANLKVSGITLGQTTEMAQNLQSLLAVEVSKGGKVLNVMSQVSKVLDGGILYGHEIIDGQMKAIKNLEVEAAAAKRAKYGQYGQNVWRRLLVSSPATTAVNVMGFGQFAVGQSLADIFSGTTNTLWGLAQGGTMTKGGRESLRIGKVYRQMQTQKIRNLMDPYTTHDAYMAFLAQNKDVRKIMFESFTGGVARSGERHGINPNAKWFQRTETTVDAMNRLTGVKIQDTFTKSQMFIGEMDKHIRLKNPGETLESILKSGKLDAIDNDVIGYSLDTTLKSVFAKDYTTDDQLLASVAKGIEGISNMPLIGTILPFGRFFNNTLATAYQWSVGGGVQMASAMYKKSIKGVPIPANTTEAFARIVVGMTALRLAMEYDNDRLEKGLAHDMIDIGGGQTWKAQNLFPASLWLAVGRAANLSRKGEMVPNELMVDIGNQLAVGQFAKDIQFGNDMYNVFDTIFNGEEGDGSRQMTFDALYKQGGNILAGVTRPLDAVNKMVGFINNTDAARDSRLVEGTDIALLGASKYIDNIVEIFTDKLDGITGEELRVATRNGSVKNPNPILQALGVTVLPSRTATEKAFSMAEMHPWTAGERSQIAEYDKVFNSLIQPMFEDRYAKLIEQPSFKKGSIADRRQALKGWKTHLSGELRAYLQNSTEYGLLAVQRKAVGHGSKEEKNLAMKYMREDLGYSGEGPRDMNWEELQTYLDVIDYFKGQKKVKTKIK